MKEHYKVYLHVDYGIGEYSIKAWSVKEAFKDRNFSSMTFVYKNSWLTALKPNLCAFYLQFYNRCRKEESKRLRWLKKSCFNYKEKMLSL